jgi:hypothetical protein
MDPGEISRMLGKGKELQHLAAIGLVAARWSQLELIIDLKSILFARVSVETGICFTAQISGVARKFDAFISLAKLKGADESSCKKLKKFHEKVTAVAERRNRIVHDVWDFDNPLVPNRLEATARKQLRFMKIEHSTGDVLRVAEDIYKVMTEFEEITAELRVQKA